MKLFPALFVQNLNCHTTEDMASSNWSESWGASSQSKENPPAFALVSFISSCIFKNLNIEQYDEDEDSLVLDHHDPEEYVYILSLHLSY